MIKKIEQKVLIMTMAMLIVISCTFSLKTYAYFEISNYDINAKLLSNGDLRVKEEITYTSDEAANGVYSTFGYGVSDSEEYGITEFQLISVKVNGNKFEKVASAYNGRNGVYTYTDNSRRVTIKVFTPFSKRKMEKTVTYEYIYKDMAVKYKDISELYWNFMSDEFQDKIKNLTLTLTLPPGSENYDIEAFCHDKEEVIIERNVEGTPLEKRTLKLNISRGIYMQDIDLRVLFDNSALINNQHNIDRDMYDKIIKEEKGVSNIKGIFDSYKKIGMFITPFALILLIITLIEKKREDQSNIGNDEYFSEIPYDENPAILLYAHKKDFSGLVNVVLLELIRRGVYTINKENDGQREVEYIEYTLGDRQDVEFEDYEKELINKINEKISKDNNTGILKREYAIVEAYLETDGILYKTVQNMEKSVKEKFEEKYGKWNKKGKQESTKQWILTVITYCLLVIPCPLWVLIMQDRSLRDTILTLLAVTAFVYGFAVSYKESNANKIMIANISATMGAGVGLCAVCFDMAGIFHSINFILALFSLLVPFSTFIFTEQQKDLCGKLNGLKKYIEEASLLDGKELVHIVLWEKYLIMASVFNFNKEVQKYLQLKALEAEDADDSYFVRNYSRAYALSYGISRVTASARYRSITSGGFGSGGRGSRGGGRF